MSLRDPSKTNLFEKQGNLVTAVRRFSTCPEIKNSTFAIDSGDRYFMCTLYNSFHLKCHNSLNDKKVKAQEQKVSFEINPG